MDTPSRYFVGLDIGQAKDPTALAVLERPLVLATDPPEKRRPGYQLRHLKRFHLGTPYTAIVDAVVELLRAPPLRCDSDRAILGPQLVVDATGCGRPVVDMLADRLTGKVTCQMRPVTITGGAVATTGVYGTNVPKRELAGVLQVLLQARRLQIASSLPDAAVLVRELENFRVKISVSAHETYEAWREGDHDDLVLAVALAAWVGEKELPSLEVQKPRVTRVSSW